MQLLSYFKALCALLVFVVASGSAGAQEAKSPVEVLKKVWNGPKFDADDFAPEVYKKIPKELLVSILSEQRSIYGPAVDVVPTQDPHKFLVETKSYTIPTLLKQNKDGQLTGLLFRFALVKDVKHEDLLDHMKQQAPKQSFLLMQNDKVHAEHNSDDRLAVGSAFKLYVLDQLAQRVRDGDLSWQEKITLEQRHISYPGGTMQNEPVGKKFVLLDVARNMIEISDNTATDLLMDLVGQENVMLPGETSPALTTQQLFHLKADEKTAEAYRQAGPEERARILAALPAQLPSIDKVSVPLTEGIEWYISNRELCKIVRKVKDIKGIFVNPGVAEPDNWVAYAYKGGSEIGVLNMTYALEDDDGNSWCFSTTWNDEQELNITYLLALVATLLESPASVQAALQ
ncbi:Beta-lactamase enzyme family protein [Pseudovibrio denitrificans]|uniref:Beta-lactamase enzyme family protein n=1 Tax=Pseudovibrio denitrificans TaxID=258256 RepID=A0A1I7AT55_9HYPH|nr:Beta-lactamase enzyme family protein [Pseudovibrio denitrificans]